MVVVEIETGRFISTWIGLETEGIPSSSCGWEPTGGGGIGWNEEWLRLYSGKVGRVGNPFCEWNPRYWTVEKRRDKCKVEQQLHRTAFLTASTRFRRARSLSMSPIAARVLP